MNHNTPSELDDEIPDLPWTIKADMLMHIRDITFDEAIDLVIVLHLRTGDTKPLSWWLYEGHCPNAITKQYIACMLQPGAGATIKALPYELVVKPRAPKRGRPKKGPEPELRDWLIYKNITDFMERYGPGSYESAIEEVTSLDGLERATVKRAYEQIKALSKLYRDPD